MKQLFSIVGVDGSGKDYRLAQIMAQVDSSIFFPLPCTAYHHSAFCAAPALSRTLQRLGEEADRKSDPALKGISLFLKMLLFGQELRHLQKLHQAEVVLSTRHPVIDTPAYASFFIQQLEMSNEDRTQVIYRVQSLLSPTEFKPVAALLSSVKGRLDKEPLPEFIARTASLDWTEQLKVYTHIFNIPLPDRILFLNPPTATILERLQARTDRVRETHEQALFIQTLNQYLEQTLSALCAWKPEINLYATPNKGEALDNTIRSFFSLDN